MTRSALWQLSITTSPQAESAVLALFELAFPQPAVSYVDLETKRATVSVYLPQRPPDLDGLRARLRPGLREIRNSELDLGPARLTVKRLLHHNWAQAWKRHFAPLEIGSSLLLKPSWSRRRPRRGQVCVVLDPGLSFGTGRHPTTAFCLGQIVFCRRAGPQSFLDLGTGSGILAIAAAKLGFAPVHAVDIDPQAILTSRANARRNRVTARISLFRRDIARSPSNPARRYSMVCANLTADLLLACRSRLAASLQPGGVLVLAGILKKEFLAVQTAYEAGGLALVAARSSGEWRSGAFQAREDRAPGCL